MATVKITDEMIEVASLARYRSRKYGHVTAKNASDHGLRNILEKVAPLIIEAHERKMKSSTRV